MKKSVKVALTTGALGVAGALLLAGSSYADRGGFGPQLRGMMGGPGGHGGPIMEELLQGVDANADGALSQDEINEAVTVRFETFDANKDGSLSLEEYEALWADITRPLAVRTFQFLDPNGDAAVSKAEVDAQFGAVVAHMDRNDDGVLDQADRPHHRGGRGEHGPRGHHHHGDHGPRGDGPRSDGDGPRGDGPRGDGPRAPGGGDGPQQSQ